jgi:hypothetical protein
MEIHVVVSLTMRCTFQQAMVVIALIVLEILKDRIVRFVFQIIGANQAINNVLRVLVRKSAQ